MWVARSGNIKLLLSSYFKIFTAWELIKKNLSAIAALEAGCTVCEEKQCDYTVGYGGSPDENGETTLDALIFDG